MLSLLTKIASGYWHVADSQAGYTALSLDVLRRLDLEIAHGELEEFQSDSAAS